jgi:hypothetical protein
MMTGSYKLYLDGELVVAENNLITTFGKSAVLRYLASSITSYAGSLAVGVSNKNPSVSDYVLDYELFRVPIAYRTANMTNSSVTFKGTAGGGISGTIYELGLFPSQNNELSGAFQTATVFTMDSGEAWQNVVLRDTTNSRVGSSAITMNATTGSSVYIYNSDIRLDISGYSATDVFKLAFNTFDVNCTSVVIRFTNADGAEIVGTFVPATHTAGNGVAQYQIVSLTKNQFSNQNANWANIIKAEVILYAGAGASQVSVDGLKVIDADNLNPEFGLVSRSVLATPTVKPSNQTLDIEYSLVVPI